MSRRSEYLRYLQGRPWSILKRKKRKLNPLCEVCGSKKGICVHHVRYRELWNTRVEDLVTMCRKCHDEYHVAIGNTKNGIDIELGGIKTILWSFRSGAKPVAEKPKLLIFDHPKPQYVPNRPRAKTKIKFAYQKCKRNGFRLNSVETLIKELVVICEEIKEHNKSFVPSKETMDLINNI